jgi:IS5 family transposase
VPVELGVRSAFLEDQFRLILNHRVMHGLTDEKITVEFSEETLILFPNLRAISFDKGFYSPDNRDRLDKRFEQVTLPKKGRLSHADQARESSEAFVNARQQHPAIESAIHALQVHGLDRCRDRVIEGFDRYIAWGVIGFNLHKLGAILLEREHRKRQRARLLAA